MTTAESSFALVSVIIGSRNVASGLYLGVGARTIVPGVSGRDIALAALIWRTGPWFIVAVDWSNSVWVMVMDVYMLGLSYFGVRDRTVTPGVSGCNIALDVLIWIIRTFFLVEVDWSHSVWVVVMDVGMLGLMLVCIG